MLLFIERAAQSTQVEQIRPEQGEQEPPEANSRPGSDIMQSEVQIYRLTGPLFFASSERVLTRLTREVTAKTLVLDLTEAGPIDSAATDCLRRIARRQRNRGGELYLIGLDRRLFAFLAKDGILKELGAAIRRDEKAYQGSRYDPFLKRSFDVSEQDVPINLNPVSRSGGK
jgi:MFS superfamily sulfate permease-like transporter